jgi:hypothetical protein
MPDPSAVCTRPVVDVVDALIVFGMVVIFQFLFIVSYRTTHFDPVGTVTDTPLAIVNGPTLTADLLAVIV